MEKRIAVGTKVRHVDGRVGTVKRDDGSSLQYLVRWDDANEGTRWCTAEELTPLTPETTAPLPELTINGHRYVLAPEQAEAKEEAREPKMGEIWRFDSQAGTLMQVTETGYYWPHDGQRGMFDKDEITTHFTFAYPSLAAAIKAGETFE